MNMIPKVGGSPIDRRCIPKSRGWDLNPRPVVISLANPLFYFGFGIIGGIRLRKISRKYLFRKNANIILSLHVAKQRVLPSLPIIGKILCQSFIESLRKTRGLIFLRFEGRV